MVAHLISFSINEIFGTYVVNKIEKKEKITLLYYYSLVPTLVNYSRYTYIIYCWYCLQFKPGYYRSIAMYRWFVSFKKIPQKTTHFLAEYNLYFYHYISIELVEEKC